MATRIGTCDHLMTGSIGLGLAAVERGKKGSAFIMGNKAIGGPIAISVAGIVVHITTLQYVGYPVKLADLRTIVILAHPEGMGFYTRNEFNPSVFQLLSQGVQRFIEQMTILVRCRIQQVEQSEELWQQRYDNLRRLHEQHLEVARERIDVAQEQGYLRGVEEERARRENAEGNDREHMDIASNDRQPSPPDDRGEGVGFRICGAAGVNGSNRRPLGQAACGSLRQRPRPSDKRE